MWRAIATVVFFCALSFSQRAEAWRDAMIYDVGWGADVPLLDSTSGDTNLPIGFVHLPLSGGYLFLTVQAIKGTPRVVVTRFQANGALDTHWKDPASDPYIVLGSAIVALPVPDLDSGSGKPMARIAIEVVGSSERIYFAELIGSGATLRISRFDPSLDVFDSAAQTSPLTGGFGSIEAMTAGAWVGSIGLCAVVAVQGTGTNATTSMLYGASASPLTIVAVGSHSNPGFRINAMTARADGSVDVAGTEGDQAHYLLMKTASPTVTLNETFFDLKCPSGLNATASALDALVPAPPAFPDDDTFVLGRADCGSAGRISMIERVARIRYAGSLAIDAYSAVDATTNCPGRFASAPCPLSYLAASGDAANSLLAMTPDASLAHVDSNAGTAHFLGDEANPVDAGYPLVIPTSAIGASLEYPYLVGLSLTSSNMPGIRRVAVDRIFADGYEKIGP